MVVRSDERVKCFTCSTIREKADCASREENVQCTTTEARVNFSR